MAEITQVKQMDLKLKQKVEDFFTLAKFKLILPILMGEDTISMSMIYYTVTSYSKEFSPYVIVNGKEVYIHRSYRSKLQVYAKDNFDAFCRQVKYPFYYEDDKYIVTTIGQLNFYKWCLEINLLDYIRENFNEIKLHMDRDKNTSSAESGTCSMSELTTSERNRYKNRVIIKQSIRPTL